MATSFFGGSFFGGEFFSSPSGDSSAIKTGTGGIDPGEGIRRRKLYQPFKPTGILDRPKRKEVADRIDESRQIQAEIAGRLAREFGEETVRIEEGKRIEEMTSAEVDFEIGVLLRKQIKTEEEEMILLLLMIS